MSFFFLFFDEYGMIIENFSCENIICYSDMYASVPTDTHSQADRQNTCSHTISHIHLAQLLPQHRISFFSYKHFVTFMGWGGGQKRVHFSTPFDVNAIFPLAKVGIVKKKIDRIKITILVAATVFFPCAIVLFSPL